MSDFLIFILLLFVATTSCISAEGKEFYDFREHSADYSFSQPGEVYFEVGMNSYLKNVEYTNPGLKGYTLTGANGPFRLRFFSGENADLHVGITARTQSGTESKNEYIPDVSLRMDLNDKWEVTCGTYTPADNHLLTDPVFHSEKYLTNPVESGFRFRYSGEKSKYETGWDWENYIEFGDTTQEKFDFRISGYSEVYRKNKSSLMIPSFFVVRHHGGEISDYSEKVLSISTFGAGILFRYCNSDTNTEVSFDQLDISQHFFGYKDLNENKVFFNAEEGFAGFSELKFYKKNFRTALSYFYGENYFAYEGNPVYSSYALQTGSYSRIKSIIGAKAAYSYVIDNSNHDLDDIVKITGIVETYYNTIDRKFDYAFSINASMVAKLRIWRGEGK